MAWKSRTLSPRFIPPIGYLRCPEYVALPGLRCHCHGSGVKTSPPTPRRRCILEVMTLLDRVTTFSSHCPKLTGNHLFISMYSLSFLFPPEKPPHRNMPATSESSTQLHRAPKVHSFACLEGWPALPDDLTAASLESTPKPLPTMPPIPKDKSEGWSVDESNTMVVVIDDSGAVESLVHGGFAAGTIHTKTSMLQISSIAQVESSIYFSIFCPAEPQLPTVRTFELSGRLFTDRTYKIRDLMRLSTSIKTLQIYILTTLNECKEIWSGVPGREGANQINYKWLRTLGQMQEHDGKGRPSKNFLQLPALL